jgi:alkylhydroperoxidase family enzyme
LPQETLDAVLKDWTTADIPERTRAALRLLECMSLHPLDLDKAFVSELHASGLDDLAIQEAANVGFHYNLINRVADALDFPVPQGIQKERLAKMLNITGRLLKGSAAEEVWVRGEGGVIRPTEVEIGRAHMLSANGVTDPSLRRSVEAFVMAEWGSKRGDVPPVPAELETFLKKLSLHAYKTTDEDIQTLQNAGYTDEMLYEITIVGSIGAALVGLEKLFEALFG